jgi:hypothetical protein
LGSVPDVRVWPIAVTLGTEKHAAGFDPNGVDVALFPDDLAYVKLQKSAVDARNRKDSAHASFEQCLRTHPRRKRFGRRNHLNAIPDFHAAPI